MKVTLPARTAPGWCAKCSGSPRRPRLWCPTCSALRGSRQEKDNPARPGEAGTAGRNAHTVLQFGTECTTLRCSSDWFRRVVIQRGLHHTASEPSNAALRRTESGPRAVIELIWLRIPGREWASRSLNCVQTYRQPEAPRNCFRPRRGPVGPMARRSVLDQWVADDRGLGRTRRPLGLLGARQSPSLRLRFRDLLLHPRPRLFNELRRRPVDVRDDARFEQRVTLGRAELLKFCRRHDVLGHMPIIGSA